MSVPRSPALVAVLAVFALLAVAGAAAPVAGQSSVGVVIGEPTGLSMRAADLQFHAAWSFQDDGALHVSGDRIMQFENMESGLVWYWGLGLRLQLANEVRFGPRLPVGLLYPDAGPFEVFVEVGPVLDLTPETALRVNGGLGVRWVLGRHMEPRPDR
jgi:hypothetical protein